MIVDAREQGGRVAFDAARKTWAESLKVQPDDGLFLGEVRNGPSALDQVVAALEGCGKTKTDAIEALERLVDAGLIAAPAAGANP